MPIVSKVRAIVLSISMCSLTFVNVEAKIHPFEVESGMVTYQISGGAQLTPETNLRIEGSAKLRFKSWGDVKLEEEEGTVLTTGAIKHKQHIHKLEKQTEDKIITVDYENEQLLERKKGTSVSNMELETEGLMQRGQDLVSGFSCKIWVGQGVQKCIYKGIVLKQESHVLGVSYVKIATNVQFDINATEQKCVLPDYPLQDFGLLQNNIKTKNSTKVDNFCKILKDVAFNIDADAVYYEVVNMEDKVRQKFINHIAKDIFKRQKKLLPELLVSMKETRACLQMGKNPFEANQCIEQFSRMKSKLGTEEDDYIILWDEKRKNAILDKIEDELIYLQSRIPCVNRAKNITDLSTCMK